MTKQGSQSTTKAASAREQRLKQALKANISRRKAQAKARAHVADADKNAEHNGE